MLLHLYKSTILHAGLINKGISHPWFYDDMIDTIWFQQVDDPFILVSHENH